MSMTRIPLYKRAVFMSIKPQYCYQIFTGKKTIEVRKNKPIKMMETPFDVYVYCTAPAHRTRVSTFMTVSEDELYVHPKSGLKYGSSIELMCCDLNAYSRDNFLNGKCIGKITVDKIMRVDCDSVGPFDRSTKEYCGNAACLTREEFIKYSNGKILYGWHIKDYELFKHPFTAVDFPTFTRINRPPQSWQYIHIDTETLNERNKYISSEEYDERENAKKERMQ